MIFTSIPENYQPITQPLIYQIDLGEHREFVDVKILDMARGEVLAIKRFYDVQTAEVDITALLAKSFRFRFVEGGTSIVDAEGLYAAIALEIDGTQSEVRYFSPYSLVEGCSTVFRGGSKLQPLARQESDCVVVYAPSGGTITCEAYCNGSIIESLDMDIEPSVGLQIFKLLASDFPEESDEIIVQFEVGGIVDYATYRIQPKPELSHRLVWIALDGTLQLYTFPVCRSRRIAVKKERIHSVEGVAVTACESEEVLILVSDYESVAEIERLGEIIESKQVWVERGARGVRVDILSSESVVRYGGALNSLQIEISPCDRKERLL